LTLAQSDNELHYWLALLRAPRVGSHTFNALLERFGSPARVLAEPLEALTALGLGESTVAWLRNPDWAAIDEELRWLAAPDRHCLTLEDDAYPPLLREIPDPPPLLFVRGHANALACRQFAIVGSRNPSPTGEKLARDFAKALTDAGFAITSGLALGIDAASHRGALDGAGITLAVAGTGLDQVYPARHLALAEEILAQGGALISEFPIGTAPQAGNFPRRNRIISGLSVGVLVVEAALRSGSLITARMALEQGREVFAMPGSIHNPLSRGCNALIKQGAKLVESVTDILEELGAAVSSATPAARSRQPEDRLDEEYQALLKYIAYDPTSVDTLITATGSTPEAISSMLMLLELQGYIHTTSGGGYCRTK
jgi:DNA processing protein